MINAVILAAGKGSRLNNTDYEGIPKSLIKMVDGKSSLDILIDVLNNNTAIEFIYLVVGYKSNLFKHYEFNNSKVRLLYNNKYDDPSNQYSFLSIANNYNSIIIDADTYVIDRLEVNRFIANCLYNINRNFILTCDKKNSDSEWRIESDKNNKIIDVSDNTKYNTCHVTSGIVYLSSNTILDIKIYLSNHCTKYWDDYYKKYYDNFNEYYVDGYNKFLEIDTKDNIDNINKYIMEHYYENT